VYNLSFNSLAIFLSKMLHALLKCQPTTSLETVAVITHYRNVTLMFYTIHL